MEIKSVSIRGNVSIRENVTILKHIFHILVFYKKAYQLGKTYQLGAYQLVLLHYQFYFSAKTPNLTKKTFYFCHIFYTQKVDKTLYYFVRNVEFICLFPPSLLSRHLSQFNKKKLKT